VGKFDYIAERGKVKAGNSSKRPAKAKGTQKTPTVVAAPETPAERETIIVTRQMVRGKRSDPSYTQGMAYVKKETLRKVKKRLLEEDKDYSDLINELLEMWLSK